MKEAIIKYNENPKEPHFLIEWQELIRCKDCRWWHESELEQFKGYGECGQANGIVLKPHDWFCADGEHKANK